MTIASLFQRGIYKFSILGLVTTLAACGGGGGKSNSQTAISSDVSGIASSISSSSSSSNSSYFASFLIGGAIQGNPLNVATMVTTLAGAAPGVNGTGAAARFGGITGTVSDGTNLYIADTSNHTIRKIVLVTGVVTTLAGNGSSGDVEGTGTAARFSNPLGITTDGVNLYVTDTGNYKIRKIVIATGVVTTLAGSLYSSGDGTGVEAGFIRPTGITTDGINLYITDYDRIRKVVIATGVVTTLAGSGHGDGTGLAAGFDYPRGITTDGTNLYVVDYGNFTSIRKIVIATRVVTTLAGGSYGYRGVDGTGMEASFSDNCWGITTDGVNLYVSDTDNYKIRKIVIATGVVTTLAGVGFAYGSVDGIGTAARFYRPFDITIDGTNLYVTDSNNYNIRKIVIASGVVTTLAGASADADGTGSAASFYEPYGITTDGTNLYIADYSNHSIRKVVIETGVVTTLAGSPYSVGRADGTGVAAKFSNPKGITTDGTNLYIADAGNNAIRKVVLATGVVTTLASNDFYSRYDPHFNRPDGITTDGANLYITNTDFNNILKIVIATGVVTTLAGDNSRYSDRTINDAGGYVDGIGTEARFSEPRGITTDGTNLYVADTHNLLIRKIVIATGVVTTLAGSRSAGSVDGVGTAASFGYPAGITTDGTNLYIADTENNQIRKIVIATGLVTTLAGNGSNGSADGIGVAANFYHPRGITTDGFELFVTDTKNNTIRKIH